MKKVLLNSLGCVIIGAIVTAGLTLQGVTLTAVEISNITLLSYIIAVDIFNPRH